MVMPKKRKDDETWSPADIPAEAEGGDQAPADVQDQRAQDQARKAADEQREAIARGQVLAPEGDFSLGTGPDAAIVVAADLIEANPTPAPETPYEIDEHGVPQVPPRTPDLDRNWRHSTEQEGLVDVEPTGPSDPETGERLPIINRHSPEGARVMEMKLLWPVVYEPREPDPPVPETHRVDLRRR
jgi:pyruvate/2-oxoglutarate dehydrogenase complex dihydrolipoamide acyltransferase (E2) component